MRPRASWASKVVSDWRFRTFMFVFFCMAMAGFDIVNAVKHAAEPGWAIYYGVFGVIMLAFAAGYFRDIGRSRVVNVRYVSPRCLRDGHKWQRMDDMPVQFCRRHRCFGARVAPYVIEHAPADFIAEMERVLDEHMALSMDRSL